MMNIQDASSDKGNLGIDISRAAYKVLTTDPSKVKQLTKAIKKIDEVLRSGYTDQLLYENKRVCSEFPEIIFARQSGITRVTEEFLRSQTPHIQYESLKAIRLSLYNAVQAGKTIQAIEEAGKVAIKHANEKYLGLMADQ
jgi:hypothetical protein